MNRRERRAMERLSKKEFKKVRDMTLSQLKKQYPDMNFTENEMVEAQETVKQIIENEQKFK
jgi:hypothetical protein